ncbi:hypothetical protein BH24PSE2_BH24PSE2_13090 [soil metagenome]
MRTEVLPDDHVWLRIAGSDWADPLDPGFAARRGGRWNPPDSFPTLYFNEDVMTARLNLRHYIADWPYEPEDLRNDTGPVLVSARLPRHQRVCEAHTRRGIAALGLPATYPIDEQGRLIPHARCQRIGERAARGGLRGVRCRSARAPDGAGRELAWFPATGRSRARRVDTARFEEWFWG